MRVAVVGATGAVGQTTLKILEERKFPVSALRAIASSRSAGSAVSFKGDQVKVEALGPGVFAGIDIALFSAGSAQSREYAPQAVKAGALVVDKSSAFRMDPAVPLVVPEINGHAASRHQGIVACPNCTTIVTVMPLKPLHDAGRLRRVIATSFQAVSGAGVNGVEELRRQTLTVGARRGAHHPALRPPDRLQRNPAHRPLRRRRLHRGRAEAGARGAEDPRAARPRDLADHRPRPRVHRALDRRQRGDRRGRRRGAGAPGVLGVPGASPLGRAGREPLSDARDRRGAGRLLRRPGPARICRCRTALNFWVVGDQLGKGAALNGIQIAELLIR